MENPRNRMSNPGIIGQKTPLDLRNSDEIAQDTCPLDNECYLHRTNFITYGQAPDGYAATLSKNYYITSERWGRCPYPAQFVGCSHLRSG
jgi:hypothetical protein